MPSGFSADMAPIEHGGDLAAVRDLHPEAPEPWIDLSTGINPRPYPVGPVSPQAWTRLPARDDLEMLLTAASVAYGAASRHEIVAASGTQAIIQALPALIEGPSVGILGFTYQEHEAVWRAAGRDVAVVDRLEDLARFDIAVLVNPNNPDGRLVAPADLAALAAETARRGGTLVVDEAFMDVIRPSASLVLHGRPANAIVLRSFGKTYGLAGLRLGFAVLDEARALRLERMLGPWAVSGPALEIGHHALADSAWLETTIARLEREAARLDGLLLDAGFDILGGTPLYRLGRHAEAQRVRRRLGAAGIHVRAFADRLDLLRFGLPGPTAAWERLARALGPARR